MVNPVVTRHSLSTVRRLLQAARGQSVAAILPLTPSSDVNPPALVTTSKPLRCFPLQAHHVGSLSSSSCGIDPPTPHDFHTHLCRMICNAKRRIKIASLYIGPAVSENASREHDLLHALANTCESRPDVDVTILLDANRALRPVATQNGDNSKTTTTTSAEAVHACLERSGRQRRREAEHSFDSLYLFQALGEPFQTLLPSPLNEIAGVFHIKAYIVDDALILSGANLSEEYFVVRQDRYMLFTNGGGGLVDFYSNLIDVLCQHAHPYQKTKKNPMKSSVEETASRRTSKAELLASLSQLFDGSEDVVALLDRKDKERKKSNDWHKESSDVDIVAYAVPTFQAPEGFFSSPLPFPSDVQVTRNLLLTALEEDPASVVRLSSAYLNPSRLLMSALSQFGTIPCPTTGSFGAAHLLTAGGTSHGFAPTKKTTGSSHGPGRHWIPSVFAALCREAAQNILPHGGKVLLYERPGWTFHAKGLWLNVSSPKDHGELEKEDPVFISDQQNLVAAIVGSGNYGARSEELDVESNCIIVLPQKGGPLQNSLAHEWNTMCTYATEWDMLGSKREGKLPSFPLRAALPYIRNLF